MKMLWAILNWAENTLNHLNHASHQADISCLDIKHALHQAERSKTDISQDDGQLFSFILSNL